MIGASTAKAGDSTGPAMYESKPGGTTILAHGFIPNVSGSYPPFQASPKQCPDKTKPTLLLTVNSIAKTTGWTDAVVADGYVQNNVVVISNAYVLRSNIATSIRGPVGVNWTVYCVPL